MSGPLQAPRREGGLNLGKGQVVAIAISRSWWGLVDNTAACVSLRQVSVQ